MPFANLVTIDAGRTHNDVRVDGILYGITNNVDSRYPRMDPLLCFAPTKDTPSSYMPYVWAYITQVCVSWQLLWTRNMNIMSVFLLLSSFLLPNFFSLHFLSILLSF